MAALVLNRLDHQGRAAHDITTGKNAVNRGFPGFRIGFDELFTININIGIPIGRVIGSFIANRLDHEIRIHDPFGTLDVFRPPAT